MPENIFTPLEKKPLTKSEVFILVAVGGLKPPTSDTFLTGFTKNLSLVFLLIILAETLSFLGYYYQLVNFIAFFAITILVLILSLYRLKYGLYVLLAELLIGSFGYLFYFENDGLKVSLRLALWLIIMSVWLAGEVIKLAKTKKLELNFFRSSYLPYFLVLFIFIVGGAANGFLKNNSINNIFFDANNWLYFLLVFPIFSVWQTNGNLKIIKQIFLASTVWLSFKTIILAYIFSHDFNFFALDLYLWVRRSGVGEITQIAPGFSRIFMQSHIFVLIGIFVLLFYLLMNVIARSASERGSLPRIKCGVGTGSAISRTKNYNKNNHFSFKLLVSEIASLLSVARNDKKELLISFSLLILYLSTIIISFSRSFWLGLAAGGLFVYLAAIFKLKINLKKFIAFNLTAILAIALSLTLTFLIIKFPYPKPPAGLNATDLLSERTTQITGEAGASSRWQLLPRLWQKIKTAPILGQGFGATITYKSNDPRVLAASPKGEYTTYAFEWGWLDIWLKLGFLGLLAYLVLFIKIIYDGLRINSHYSLGLAAGLAIIAAVNIFSPYANHPLGIGYLMIAAVIMERLKFLP